MIIEYRRLEWSGLIVSSLALAAVTGIALGGLAVRASATRLERHLPAPRAELPRLAVLDEAIAHKEVSRAIHEWRDAYGVALGSRRWEAMVEMGDAALRIDKLAGRAARYPTGFRAEARQAYLRALFLARSAGSTEGIERVAEAFAALGDAEMAARARAVAVEKR
jgi:hypothetical protein